MVKNSWKKCYYALYLSKDYGSNKSYKTVMLNKSDMVIIPGSSHPSPIAYHQTLCFTNFLAEAIKEKSEIINKLNLYYEKAKLWTINVFKRKDYLSKLNIYIYLDKDILGFKEYYSYTNYLKINIQTKF